MLTDEMKHEIEAEAGLYEQRQAAAIEALKIVQRHRGWVDDASVGDIAAVLNMTPDEVDSVATFYNLIYRRPVGRHVIRVCSSVSCYVMGYASLREHLRARWGIALGETTKDGRFTLIPNQCLGACDHAPTLMIDDDLHHDLTPESIDAILEKYE
ncbi:MAG: NADH-quinone oxidoreductase subunit NuoE [Candidatus Hydrogenedentes bacterium]|nr:NADH-quinone oxidoreductase subunit NuoE [Candidatus Hydrogenedentota bacterium]